MANKSSKIEFPAEIEAKIRDIAQETGSSYEEVVNMLMRAFFQMVDDSEKKNVPAFVEKVRKALGEKAKASSN